MLDRSIYDAGWTLQQSRKDMPNEQQHEDKDPAEGTLSLEIPNHILNLRSVGLTEKVLLAHFYSFSSKGCWQSNATLAEMFMTSPSSISRSIAALKKAGLIAIKAPKGCYRTIWARSHPQVPTAQPPHMRKNAQ